MLSPERCTILYLDPSRLVTISTLTLELAGFGLNPRLRWITIVPWHPWLPGCQGRTSNRSISARPRAVHRSISESPLVFQAVALLPCVSLCIWGSPIQCGSWLRWKHESHLRVIYLTWWGLWMIYIRKWWLELLEPCRICRNPLTGGATPQASSAGLGFRIFARMSLRQVCEHLQHQAPLTAFGIQNWSCNIV